ncbi:hypothetical protein [Methylobacter sp.]|nr:hypothetical protein [Methylobacter sp.]
MRTSLCVNALQMASWRRKPELGLHIILIEAANTQARNTEITWG